MAVKPEVILGDITTLDVDVIVNAANPSLLGGGGVDGAIHRAAGPALLAACKQVLQQQGECPPGHAVITIAGNLPASAVIHTVGPVWHGGDGVYGYPKEEAAAIAVRTVTAFLTRYNPLERVLFVCFDEETAAIYRRLLASYP